MHHMLQLLETQDATSKRQNHPDSHGWLMMGYKHSVL